MQSSIRPEALIVDDTNRAENTITAKITAVNYLGRIEEYQLVAADVPLKAVHYNPGIETKKPGDTVQIKISAEAIIPLRN